MVFIEGNFDCGEGCFGPFNVSVSAQSGHSTISNKVGEVQLKLQVKD